MKVSYFPGCTLRTKAKELDVQARACAKKLGVELCEIENWQCCGGYIALENEESARKKSRKVLENAKNCGADLVVTACPLCRYNLARHSEGTPAVYFTELLAQALGVEEEA